MTVREFGAHLGVSDRMVSAWEAGGVRLQPRAINQAALDTSLTKCTDEERQRFADLLAPPAVPSVRWCLLVDLPVGNAERAAAITAAVQAELDRIGAEQDKAAYTAVVAH
jgi:hypothetical protein